MNSIRLETPRSGRALPFGEGWRVRQSQDVVTDLLSGGKTPGEVHVRLPHDAMLDRRSPGAASGPMTGYHESGAFTYLKTFEVPAEWRDRVVLLEFEGVFRDASVYLNNVLVGTHSFGYSGFVIELDGFLRFGTENTLKVECRTHLDSRWYSGAGIYRPVNLHVLDPVHIDLDGVEIVTLDLDDDLSVVEVTTAVSNVTRHTRTVRLRTDLVDSQGRIVATDSSPVTVLPGTTATQRSRVTIPDPQPWSPGSPALYQAVSRLEDGDAVIDEARTGFGLRTLQLDARRGLRINGEPVKLRGAAIHHDNGPLGAATFGRAEERRIELLKAAGFNAIRSAHNPASRALLDACDRHGMLVMNESFDVWTRGKSDDDYSHDFPDRWKTDIEAMVASSRNHPSVIMYSIGNEVIEIVDSYGAAIGRNLAEYVRALDPHRYVTNALQLMWLTMEVLGSDSVAALNMVMSEAEDAANAVSSESLDEVSARVEEIASVLDVVGYNYADYRYEHDLEPLPHQIVVGSETFPSRIARYWDLVQKHPHVLGDFTWVGWDYLGEVGIGTVQYEEDEHATGAFMREYPYISAVSGDLDITGFRRPISYYREIVFGLRTDPYVAVQDPERFAHTVAVKSPFAFTDAISSWSWPDRDGDPVRVEVYAAAEEVALVLDGIEIDRRPIGEPRAFMTVFETEWRPGELTAVAYRAGQEIGRYSLRSAQGGARLALAVDRAVIHADDSDLAYVSVEIHGDDGTARTDRDSAVTIRIEGPGELVGYGTGAPATEEPFRTSTRTTFEGRALAVVRPTGAGTITVTAAAAGLDDAHVTVEAADTTT